MIIIELAEVDGRYLATPMLRVDTDAHILALRDLDEVIHLNNARIRALTNPLLPLVPKHKST